MEDGVQPNIILLCESDRVYEIFLYMNKIPPPTPYPPPAPLSFFSPPLGMPIEPEIMDGF